MKNLPEFFGCDVFGDDAMRERLSKNTYHALKKTIENGDTLEIGIANSVADAMKNWAIDKGVTHFTHWFQPMTGITAEKHDSFLHCAPGGKAIMEFSGRELIQGEPDASSFPSGGIRATFEARGYTAWDPTSYAFIKNGVLCIPTAYCSYSGEQLDKKTPLLRSMEAIGRSALRIVKLFGNDDVIRVNTTVGAEQEYFLIDRELYNQRPDLIFAGRTLYGARPPKGQELEDHYFGALKHRVLHFMNDLDQELWRMGVFAKTRHNEAAPSQHELAPLYAVSNVACDHNQLVMETMKTVAQRHGLVCLLHEKPFEGINGSGKHINWSMCTNTGINLLDPGSSPYENAQFLLILTAIIKAVDRHQDLLRMSVATAGNDHRLGANEAPPAIVSVFLGDELTEIVQSIISGNGYRKRAEMNMEIGVDVLPHFPRDNTDRNRTSPFAFTGNKFEFRMAGSMLSVSGPVIILNTIVDQALSEFADELERAENFKQSLKGLIKRELKKHARIIFNGNNYSDEWAREAETRGLLNLKSTVEALPYFRHQKNVDMFVKQGIFSQKEVYARYDILVEDYIKTLHIESLTMLDMAHKQILPAAENFFNTLATAQQHKERLKLTHEYEAQTLKALSNLMDEIFTQCVELKRLLEECKKCPDNIATATHYRDNILPVMKKMRTAADELELLVGEQYWQMPIYSQLLFSV